jgi:hypothetical protein
VSIAEQVTPTGDRAGGADAAAELDDRYGRTPGSARRTRLIFIVAAGAFALVFGAWLIWAGLIGTGAQFQTRDTGYKNVTDNSIDVQFSLTVDAGTPMRCAVQALNSSFSIIGWKIVDIPASETRTRTLVETVRTSERPVTGLIHTCWLA